jgi:hypothetical protein
MNSLIATSPNSLKKLLTYALKDGRLTHIDLVENGYKCGCICPECEEELSAIANIKEKDYEVKAHFSHKPDSNCSGGFESALHLMVKEVFAETKQIFVPDFHYDYNSRNQKSIYGNRGKIVSFDSVILEKEKKLDGEKFKPDATGFKKGKTLYLEFAVTHFCDEEKLLKIRNSKIPAIEIFVDPNTAVLDPEFLKNLLLEDSLEKYFLFNPEFEEQHKKEQQEDLDRKRLKEEEELKKENIRIKNLIQCKKYNILKIQGKEVSQCPKNKDFGNYINSSEYYNHPTIKKLAKGAFWNGEFYGHVNTVKYVYIDENREVTSSMGSTYEENKKQTLLFRGLMEFKRRNEKSVDNCELCHFKKGVNNIKREEFLTCSYIINNSPIIEAEI